MKDINLLEDIKAIAPNKKFSKIRFVDCAENDVAGALYESIKHDDGIINVDIGFGNLYIKVENNEVSYKFIPSKLFEYNILNKIKQIKNPLIKKIESDIVEKLTQDSEY